MGEELIDETKKLLEKAERQCWLSAKDFCILIQNLLIPEGEYIISTGNYENVNAALASKLANKIEKHPELWKMFWE